MTTPTAPRPLRALLVTDFHPANLAALLEQEPNFPTMAPVWAPYGRVVPALAGGEGWTPAPELVWVWTRPEATLGAYRDLLEQRPFDEGRLLEEVDGLAEAILDAATRTRWLFVSSWARDALADPHASAAWRAAGAGRALARANLRLAERLEGAGNVAILDAERWMRAAGPGAYDDKLWYQGKIPFGHAVFRESVLDLKAAVDGLSGRARKLVVLDLDDTLWGGIVGEVGWEGVRLGGHDAIGEAFVDFQRALKALTRRGVVLAVVSKNDESTALEVFRRHPEMQLGLDDLAGWVIGWGDKATAIVDLVTRLNLGLETVVFIDDHPVERARVRETLPEVLVPEWPRHPLAYVRALRALRCFDQPVVSTEDRERAQSYVNERERADLRRRLGSIEDWLRSLETVVTVEPLGTANLPRAAQLLNKTNQMNLTTRRMAEPELRAWADAPGNGVWLFRVADRFGDAGITGLASLSVVNGGAQIVDFVLSCRVMGRGIEETMLHVLVDRARAASARTAWAEFVPTPRNGPCLEFWKRSGLVPGDGARFVWDAGSPYGLPAAITLAVPSTSGD